MNRTHLIVAPNASVVNGSRFLCSIGERPVLGAVAFKARRAGKEAHLCAAVAVHRQVQLQLPDAVLAVHGHSHGGARVVHVGVGDGCAGDLHVGHLQIADRL